MGLSPPQNKETRIALRPSVKIAYERARAHGGLVHVGGGCEQRLVERGVVDRLAQRALSLVDLAEDRPQRHRGGSQIRRRPPQCPRREREVGGGTVQALVVHSSLDPGGRGPERDCERGQLVDPVLQPGHMIR